METIEAGAIADLIKKIFFSTIDNIFDRAVEYKNDMGVLKQVNKIAVKDPNGNGHVVEIILSPIKDRESEYVVDISCDTLDKLKGISRINGKALKIDRSNKKEFSDLVKKILKSNKLIWVSDKKEAQDIIDGQHKDPEEIKKVIEFYYEGEGNDNPPVVTVTRVMTPLEDGKVEFTVTAEPNLTTQFPSGEFKSKDKAEVRYMEWIDDNLLVPKSERDKEAKREKAKDLEKEMDKSSADKDDESDISSTIYVGLRKVAGSTQVEITKIYAANYSHAADVVECALDDSEFFDSITEDENFYKIDEYNDDIDINECEFPSIN